VRRIEVTTVRSAFVEGHRVPEKGIPYRAGERLEYRAHFGRLGEIGKAVLSVEGPAPARDHSALIFDFDLRGRFGPFRIRDRTRSWVCEDTRATLRYHKDEQHPLSSRTERVEVFPDERRWMTDADSGATSTDVPLDELSFLYYLRTIDLEPGARLQIDSHFDRERNPVVVHVVGREQIRVPAGEMKVLHVELRVRDRRLGGDGVLHIYFSDDSRRIPVMIESDMPMVGTVRLSLEAARL
jgi:hypothetical protein